MAKTAKKSLSDIGNLERLDDIEDREKIPTGIYNLDKILTGGIPKGTIVEAFGKEGGAKSCIGLQLIGQAQNHGECVYYDLENAFDPKKAANSGIDTKKLYFGKPSSGEEMFGELEEILGTPGVSCVVIDSVAAIQTEAQLAGDYGDALVASLARLMSPGLGKLNDFMRQNNPDTILFFINQVRENIGGFGGGFSSGPTEFTPGGRGLKFYASTRLKVARMQTLKNNEVAYGQKTVVESVKSRFSPPFQKTTFDLYYDTDIGVSNESSIFDDAVSAGLIKKAGSWYSNADGESLGQGKDKVLAKMRSEPDFTADLLAKIEGSE